MTYKNAKCKCHCEPEQSEGVAIYDLQMVEIAEPVASAAKQSQTPSLLQHFVPRNRFAPRNDNLGHFEFRFVILIFAF